MPATDGHEPLFAMVGERVARARAAADLSQEKLSKKVGVTRASIVNIEHGRQRAPLHLLWKIAASLGVEVASFVPTNVELATRGQAVQLNKRVVAAIERAAQNDPVTNDLLTAFIQHATSRIEGTDGQTDGATR